MTDLPTVIRVTGASKRFVIRKEKSLKERLLNFGRSNKHKDDFWALRDIDIDIKAGTTVGLIGPNGSGKSTLLKLIGGILQPTTGTVEHRGRLAALLELGAGFHQDLTGRENVYLNASILGLSTKQTDKYFDAIVAFSGIEPFIDTQVKFYSSGMYVRLAFAVAVHVDPDLLLVDEVLAVGDEPFQRKCMDRIREFQKEGRTIVVVTHSLDQVADLCDRAIVLERGKVQIDGPPKEALRHLRADFDAARQQEIDQERVAAAAAAAAETLSESVDVSDESTEAPAPSLAPLGRITGVRLTDLAGGRLPVITPGDDLQVTLDLELGQRIDDAVLGIGIDGPLGQIAFGINTRLMGVELPSLAGIVAYTFRLSNVHLAEGQYYVHGALARDGGVELHRLTEAATLTVHSETNSVGFVDIHTELISGPGVTAGSDRVVAGS